MIKYTKKTLILLILFFSSLFLLGCASSNRITVRNCYAITSHSDCSLLLSDMISANKELRTNVSLAYNANFKNSFSSLVGLSRKKVDFAFLPYDLFQHEEFKPYTKDLQVIKKVFFIPLLAVVKSDSPYKSLKDLENKNIGLGLKHDETNTPEVLNIFKNLNMSYQKVEAKEIDFPALLDDGGIDMFLCFTVDCAKVIQKVSQVQGQLRFLPIELDGYKSTLENINLDISTYLGVSNPDKHLKTVGIWQDLVTRKGTNPKQIEAVSQALKRAIDKNHYPELLLTHP